MCGVAGWCDTAGNGSPPIDLLVMYTLLASRGTDASGAMWSDRAKGKLCVLKGATPSYRWAATTWESLSSCKPTWVALHARAATLGPAVDNNNNHPVNVGSVWLMHNGIIYNHEEVFKKLQQKRPAAVDTAAVAACLARGGLSKVLELCRGSMTLAWVDRQEVGKLHLYTNGRSPLWVSGAGSMFVYASTEGLLPERIAKKPRSVEAGTHIILEAGKKPIEEVVGVGGTTEEQRNVWPVYWSGGMVTAAMYECFDAFCKVREEHHKHPQPRYTSHLHSLHKGVQNSEAQ